MVDELIKSKSQTTSGVSHKKSYFRDYYLKHKDNIRLKGKLKRKARTKEEKEFKAGQLLAWRNKNKDRQAIYDSKRDRRKRLEQKKEWRGTFNGWLLTAVQRCRQRKGSIVTTQDIRELWETQKGLCAITKHEMDWRTPKSMFRPSIDRLDNRLGYFIGNIRLVLTCVNIARNTLTDHEFKLMCKLVVEAEYGVQY